MVTARLQDGGPWWENNAQLRVGSLIRIKPVLAVAAAKMRSNREIGTAAAKSALNATFRHSASLDAPQSAKRLGTKDLWERRHHMVVPHIHAGGINCLHEGRQRRFRLRF